MQAVYPTHPKSPFEMAEQGLDAILHHCTCGTTLRRLVTSNRAYACPSNESWLSGTG